MTAVQKRVIGLLNEVDEICLAEGITYSLAGRTAAMYVAAGGFTCDDYQADIMMSPSDYAKFCKAVGGKKDRAIESLETNPLMDGVYARYVDISTTLIDIKRGSQLMQKGVCVRIWVLRSKALRSRYAKALETLVRTNSIVSLKIRKEYCPAGDRKKLTALGAARTLLERPGAMKKFFANCTADEGSSKYYFYYDGKDKVKVPRKSMANTSRGEFEGVELSVAADMKGIAEAACGKDFKAAVSSAEFPSEEWGVYYDLAHPFAQVMREAEGSGTDFGRLALEKADYDEFGTRVYRKKLSQADKQYKYVWRTINRFRLLDEYEGRTDEIKKKFAEGGADAVREDMAPYIEMIEDYAKIKMGFAIDSELLEIAYAVMTADGKEETVKKAKKLLPDEYGQDLAEWLTEQGYKKQSTQGA